jgi:cytosine/adenosine deaminase-related metal-dependent hydrolase
LGAGQPEITTGAAADLVSLDPDHQAFYGRGADRLFDSWIFSAGCSGVDCVWRRGRKLVSKGEHVARAPIIRRYRAVLEKILT